LRAFKAACDSRACSCAACGARTAPRCRPSTASQLA
jgi:hypothetical protein